MQVLLLIAGLILVLAGGSWFAGATTVGVICLVLFGIATLVQILAVLAASKVVRSPRRRF